VAHKRAGRPLADFPGGRAIARDALVGVPCEIWIPAARPDTLTEANVSGLQARLVIQGANIPATEPAERWMHAHHVLSVPDFIANAGGVICAAIEYHGGTQAQAFAAIEERIRANTRETLDRASAEGIVPREAASRMALARVREAMRYRRP
jgi:glutamate dehydrogenase/leucine dehydrogenase